MKSIVRLHNSGQPPARTEGAYRVIACNHISLRSNASLYCYFAKQNYIVRRRRISLCEADISGIDIFYKHPYNLTKNKRQNEKMSDLLELTFE